LRDDGAQRRERHGFFQRSHQPGRRIGYAGRDLRLRCARRLRRIRAAQAARMMPRASNACSDSVGIAPPAAVCVTEILSMKYATSVEMPGPPGVRASSSPAKMIVADVLVAVKFTRTVCQLPSRNS